MFRDDGVHLNIVSLPTIFEDRYTDIPSSLYIRDCYRDLYTIYSERMITGCMRRSVALFTGVPGIGKSMFLIYFLYRFLKDGRFPDKTFAVEFKSGKYGVFYPTDNATEFTFQEVSRKRAIDKDFLLLCDLSTREEPAKPVKWTLIFSSPDPRRYKEIMKNGQTVQYTMPTWSVEELQCVDPKIAIASWIDEYTLFGGVPRYVFAENAKQAHTKLNRMLKNKGKSVANNFFEAGFGDIDMLSNYMLVHINPPDAEGVSKFKFDFDGLEVCSFASYYVFEYLCHIDRVRILNKASGIFNAGAGPEAFGSVSAGHLFERLCLYLAPIHGKTLHAASLTDSTESVRLNVPVDRLILAHDWDTATLPINTLLLPGTTNFVSTDAFYVQQWVGKSGNVKSKLVMFQVTVAETHPVRISGLSAIVRAFGGPFDSVQLVFLTPLGGKLQLKQRLTHNSSQTVQIAENQDWLPCLKQFVCRYEVPTSGMVGDG